MLNGRYKKVKKLGAGQYGTVYLAEDTKFEQKARLMPAEYLTLYPQLQGEQEESKSNLVAVKKIKLKTLEPEQGIHFTSLREIKVMQELRHPNIVWLKDVLCLQKNFFMVLEFVETDLQKLIMNKQVDLDKA